MDDRSLDIAGGGGHHREELFGRIISPENLFAAWREFRLGKKSKADVQRFQFDVEDSIFALHRELAQRTYGHGPYVPFTVADPKVRRIHKATIRDRLVHHALFRVLGPLFDRSFIHDSYSCRVGKGTHRAVRRLELFANKMSGNGRRNFWVLKCDIRRFFDSIDHEVLLSLIRRTVFDEDALWLVERILASFGTSPGVGLPLGNVTSQLFANIYLNELDRFIKHGLGCRYYLRYCDDFLILGRNPTELWMHRGWIAGFLSSSLRLRLHPSKVMVRKYSQGIDFLGYVVRPHHTVLRTCTKRRMFARINASNAASYMGILEHCNGYVLKNHFFKTATVAP